MSTLTSTSPTYVQGDRPLTVTIEGLAPDLLKLGRLSGHEAISQLFGFQLDLMAENPRTIAFDAVLGKKVVAHLDLGDGQVRHFAGLCSRFSQGRRDPHFLHYRMEVVPQFWLLTRKAQSRIFQQLTVPEILSQVLSGLTYVPRLSGQYAARDYCVQYRETDFNFACRLMEEEGIFFFFEHASDGHVLVVADDPSAHPEVPLPSRIHFQTYSEGERVHGEGDIATWEKTQELRSGQYTLWDHHFELPHKHFEAKKATRTGVRMGTVDHLTDLRANASLELYDYPGEYAQRYDGITPGGGDRPANLDQIYQDKDRTVTLRMQEEEAAALIVHGTSQCRQLTSGHKFALEGHFDANGPYVLTAVQHEARIDESYRSGSANEFIYSNSFTCIPADLPYRPQRTTPKPFVQGPQTAVVVGPAGEEIFCDKYSRVKVQFHWDRQGKNDINSSCWIRVGTIWAGKQWGAIHIPRIGQEVIVDFEEGDPDRPLITGSVYNADMMPPYTLPENKSQSGIKSSSTLGGGGSNELRFEDKKGSEDIFFHAQKDAHRVVKHDDDLKVLNDQTIAITNNRTETVKQGNETVTIQQGNRTINVKQGDDTHNVDKGNRSAVIGMGNENLEVKMGNRITKLGMGNDNTKLDLGASTTEAMQSITLKVGQSSIVIDQMGVTIKGMMVTVQGEIQAQVKSVMTQISGTAMLQAQGGITMIN